MNSKLFTFVILSLASVALAGPAGIANKIQETKGTFETIKTPAAETLKQWCVSSEMSQPELTQLFKKLVAELQQSPPQFEQLTDAVIVDELVCQAVQDADMNAVELIKDLYMDALSACRGSECMRQLVKAIETGKIDNVRSNYYMTRLAVNDNKSAFEQKDMIQGLSESLVQPEGQSLVSKAIQRQKMFAVTANLAKQIKKEMEQKPEQTWEQCPTELKQTVERVARAINARFVKPVTQSDIEEYKQKSKTPTHLAEKIAERNAALKALANIPGHVLAHIDDVEQTLMQLAKNKQELSTVRQSAIEALEQNDNVEQLMTDLALHQQDEPTEIRVAAYRCLMTTAFAGPEAEPSKKQNAHQIIAEVLKHVENQQNQQQDEQFVLYVVSHLDNLRTSENPDHAAIKECIHENKQHHMQISLLNKKFKHQIQKIGKSSRNFQLDQTFDKIESGLILEGDAIFDQQQPSVLPKLLRVNVSLPILGQTVNVIEVAIRQDNMEQEFVSALRPLQGAKFSAESIEKVVGEFKQQVNRQQQQQPQGPHNEASEADIAIKVDGCTIVYLCADDLKTQEGLSRQTRSVRGDTSALEDILEQLKRNKLSFNRGFHFDISKRIASVLDIEAHLIGGLLFDSRVNAQRGSDEFELQVQMEPRVSFEALVGPVTSSKRLLQRASTKSAIGMRLRYKKNEIVDVQIDLPMNEMELFRFETQMVERNSIPQQQQNSPMGPHQYSYLEDSIYGNSNIEWPEEHIFKNILKSNEDKTFYPTKRTSSPFADSKMQWKKMKRSVFETNMKPSSWERYMSGEKALYGQIETPEFTARALGLRSKLQVVASPRDATFLINCVVRKYEPSMQGYRVQVQQQPQQQRGQQSQYVVLVSTPGSRINRDVQLRIAQQSGPQRTMLKTEVQSPMMTGQALVELIHDGRQYAIKVESGSRGQLRSFEAGVQHSTQSGKIATTYKPYLLVQAPELRKPIQVQGLVSYQQSPKTVITYELKTENPAKFIQGKYILQKRSSSSPQKRSSWNRRSMPSPWEQMFQEDVTMTNEITAQWKDIAVKQVVMIESEGNTFGFDITNQYKTKHSHKTEENRLTARVQYGKDRQSVHVEHKCSAFPVHNFRFDSQVDCAKKQITAKFACANNNQAQFVADWQSKKVELTVDSEGHRLVSAETRFERQGERCQFQTVVLAKNQPWAKVSGTVPTMLLEEPAEFWQKMHRLHQAVIEFDGIVYRPTTAQIVGKIDLQKNELSALYKNDREQELKELKIRFDDNTDTLLTEALLKSPSDLAKVFAKINIPGLIETVTFTKKSSWKNSWMSGSVEPSEIQYQSRDTQLKAKLIPREELSLVVKAPRVQHESRLNLVPSQRVLKLKSSTVLDRNVCDVDAEIDVHQKIARVKAATKQSLCQLDIDLPSKKFDMILDVDGVRVLSHQSRYERSDKMFNMNSSLELWQKPFYVLSGSAPSHFADIFDDLLNKRSPAQWASYEPASFFLSGMDSEMKLKIVPGNQITATFTTPNKQHQCFVELNNGLTLNIATAFDNVDYTIQARVNEKQKTSYVKISAEAYVAELSVDLKGQSFDLFVKKNGLPYISATKNQLVHRNNEYQLESNIKRNGFDWCKIQASIPEMLLEEPTMFFRNIHRLHKAVIEFEAVISKANVPELQVDGKVDFKSKDMRLVFKNDREQTYNEIKAEFDEKNSNINARAIIKSPTDMGNANVKINLPGLVESFTFQKVSPLRRPWWLKGASAPSEVVYTARGTQLKAELRVNKELSVFYKSPTASHESKVDFNKKNILNFKFDTVLTGGRRCNAVVLVDLDNKIVAVQTQYKSTKLEFDVSLPNHLINLKVDVRGKPIIEQQINLKEEGNFYTFKSEIIFKQQPYAQISGKIPQEYLKRPISIWTDRISDETEITYLTNDQQVEMNLEYVPERQFKVYARNGDSFDSYSATHMPSSDSTMLRLNRSSNDGLSYGFDTELNKHQQASLIKAFTKPSSWFPRNSPWESKEHQPSLAFRRPIFV